MPTRDAVKAMLPELDMIGDKELREKTLDVWMDAMETGGWEVSDMPDIPFTLLIEGTDLSLLDHTRVVTQTAAAIAETMSGYYGDRMPINRDYLISGGLLHDVGKLLEYRRDGARIVKSDVGKDLRHPFSGTALAYKHDIPSMICHLIAMHAKEGEDGRRNPEAWIIHYADFVNFRSLKTL
jgi:putative nucleotidyltransferase with HDIG domain